MRRFLNEFKEFISQGSIVDLAIAFIMGAAFQTLLKALVDDIFMPVIGIVTGSISFADIVWHVGPAHIKIGAFISALITFVLTGFVVFLMVKSLNKMRQLTGTVEEAEEDEAETEVELLTQIRDALNKQ